MAPHMPLPLTASYFSKIQIGFTFLVPAQPDSPGQRAVKWVCVCTEPERSQSVVCPITDRLGSCVVAANHMAIRWLLLHHSP